MLTPLDKTLDVEVVERRLAELWQQTSGRVGSEDEFAVLRARVANLLVYVSDEAMLDEVDGILEDLTAIHPSRVLLMLGEPEKAQRDIEMSVETLNLTDRRSGDVRLCCEEVMLKASGSFTSELPSAALPLLVPDLTTFLWWRAPLQRDNKIFRDLLEASDRLVVDSAEFIEPASELKEIARLFDVEDCAHVGISDLNWARLTSWRALLAGFYDVAAYQPLLDELELVCIDYLAPKHSSVAVAPQALLIAGWLASRLGWELAEVHAVQNQSARFLFHGSRKQSITLELKRVERAEGKPGRLVRIQLQTKISQGASFTVFRSEDNLHLTTEARIKTNVHGGRVLPVRNRSAARLLGREMEILCNDKIYQEAIDMGARIIDLSRLS